MIKRARTLLLLPLLAFLLLGGGLWLESRKTLEWNDATRRVDALRDEAARRQPVFARRAWAHYDAALAMLFRTPEEDLDIVAGDALERLRRASSGDAPPAEPRFAKYNMDSFQWLPETLRRFAVTRATRLASDGRPREAAESLFDLLRFAFDLWASGDRGIWIPAFAATREPVDLLQVLVLDSHATSDDLAWMERELETLEARVPPYLLVELQYVARFGEIMLSEKPLPLWLSHVKETRQAAYLYSERLLKAAAIREADDALRLALPHAGAPYAEFQAKAREIQRALRSSGNPFTVDWIDPSASGPERQCVAELRLLRTAAHFRRTAKVLDLEDPFGQRLRHEATSGGLKIWSVGEDQAPRLRAGRRPVSTPPLTIEVER